MRKNYFAKKFVAYSMAFAVAFSTLTVSPVFVKEAKAAASCTGNIASSATGKVAAITDFSSLTNTEVYDGAVFLSTIETDDALNGTALKVEDFLDSANLGFQDDGQTKSNLKAITLEPVSGKIPNTNQKKYEMVFVSSNYGKLAASGGVVGKEVTANTVTPVATTDADKTVTIGTANPNDVAGTKGGIWFKLMPNEGTFKYSEADGTPATLREDTITYNYFTVVKYKEIAAGQKLALKLNKEVEDSYGIFMYVDKNANTEDGTSKNPTTVTQGDIKVLTNVCKQSNYVAKANKENIYAIKGGTANLTVDVTSLTPNTEPSKVTYEWSKAGNKIDCKEATLSLKDITSSDYGIYKCVVTDGMTITNVNITLRELTATEIGASKADEFSTTVKVLSNKATGNYLTNGKVNLTTIIPEGNYHYIWLDETGAVVKLATSDILSYDSTKKSIVVSDTSKIITTNDEYTCYAIPTSVYDADPAIKAALKKLSEATNDADKYAAIQDSTNGLRKAEKDLVAANTVYKETITLKAANDVNTLESQNIKATFGEKITLEVPAIDSSMKALSYVWTNSNSGTYNATGNKLVIDTVDQKDLGTITCTIIACKHTTKCADLATHNPLVPTLVETCDCSDNTYHEYDDGGDPEATAANDAAHTAYSQGLIDQVHATLTKTFNLVYASDLTATGSDVQVRDGQAAELKVTATANVEPTYQWEKVKENTTGETVTVNPIVGALAGIKSDEATLKLSSVKKSNNDYFTEKPDNSGNRYYYRCTVEDGINKIVVPVKVKEVETFKAYENQSKLNSGTALENNANLYYGGLKGNTITLAPIIVANEEIEKELTYTWKKDGVAYSTDKAITVAFEDNAATYQLTISEGTAPLTVNYNVKTLTEAQLKSASIVDEDKKVKANVDFDYSNIYTGSEINPVKKVTLVVNDGTQNYVYELKKDIDYTVKLTDAINAGVSQYEVVLVGNFADAYKGLTENQKDALRGVFTITRADNKVEIASNTVVVGKSVLPKVVTNLGKGALTYTYYADAAATTEIAAPTKVGTYYVKATAAATMNYSEAESNVAKVVIAPGKPKIGNTSRTASSVTLNWAKTSGATAYRVYIKKNGKFTKVANTTGLKYTVKGLASATTYEFAVKAFVKGVASPVYSVRPTTTAPAKVATPAVKAGSRKATVTFKKVTRATGYQVYMAKGNGKYVKVATTAKLSVTKTRLTKGATYKFKVRAYKKVGSNVYYGAFSSAKAVKVK